MKGAVRRAHTAITLNTHELEGLHRGPYGGFSAATDFFSVKVSTWRSRHRPHLIENLQVAWQ